MMRHFLFLSLLSFLPVCVCAEVKASDKIRVGIILPFSGEGASWGNAARNGMSMAMDTLSPQAKERLEFFYEDDSLSATRSVSALKQMMGTGRVDVVLNASSGTGNALAPITESHKITLLAIATDPAVCTGRKYAFNFWVTPEEETRVMLPEARRRGYRRIARINTIQDGVLAVKDLVDKATDKSFEIVLNEDFTPETKDFRTFVTKIRGQERSLDGVMVAMLPGQLGLFAKQLRSAGVKLPLFGWETLEDINEVKVSNGALVGAWYVNADDGDDTFLKRYRERFPEASSYIASNGYDMILLLGKAAEDGVAHDKIHEFLANLRDFHGALGTYSSSGDQRFTLPAAVKVVTKDGFEKVKP